MAPATLKEWARIERRGSKEKQGKGLPSHFHTTWRLGLSVTGMENKWVGLAGSGVRADSTWWWIEKVGEGRAGREGTKE
jgi:hypothetical protein